MRVFVLGLSGCMVLQICTFRDLEFVSFEVAGIWGFGFGDFGAFGL